MPEETIASQGGAVETIPAGTPTILPANQPEASSAEIVPEAESGFTADDFKHPQYGAKAKQLYHGWQKRMEEAKGYKKKSDDYEALIRYSPEVNKAVKEWWRKHNGLPAEEVTTEATGQDAPALDPTQQLDAKLAFQSIYSSLGQGDQLKGEEIFNREYHPEIESFLSRANGKDPKQVLRLAMEYIALKKGANKPATVQVEPATVASGERGGEAVTAPAGKTPETAWEAAEQEAKRLGFSSLNAYFAAENKD